MAADALAAAGVAGRLAVIGSAAALDGVADNSVAVGAVAVEMADVAAAEFVAVLAIVAVERQYLWCLNRFGLERRFPVELLMNQPDHPAISHN